MFVKKIFWAMFLAYFWSLPHGARAAFYTCMPIKVVGPSGPESLEQPQYLEQVQFYYAENNRSALIQFDFEGVILNATGETGLPVHGPFRKTLGPFYSAAHNANIKSSQLSFDEESRLKADMTEFDPMKDLDWPVKKPKIWSDAAVFSDASRPSQHGLNLSDPRFEYMMVVSEKDLTALPEEFMAQFYLKYINAVEGASRLLIWYFNKYLEITCRRDLGEQESVYDEIHAYESGFLTDDNSLKSTLSKRRTFTEPKSIDVVGPRGDLQTVPSEVLIQALKHLNEAGLNSTKEDLILKASALSGIALALKYARGLTPAGAFMAGLGLSAAAAGDRCSYLETDQGLEHLTSLSLANQFEQVRHCPQLAGEIINFKNHL